jgi:magnesium-transporting ATPase (P-type)
MPQSSATRGHWLIAIAAIVIVGSTMLQWWQIGGGPGELPLRSGVGISDGRVLLIFIAAVVSLLLVTLPFASERPIPIDHPLAYTILLVVMLIGYVLRLLDLFDHSLLPWPPQQGIGTWFIAVGFGLFARGVFEIFEEGRRRLY